MRHAELVSASLANAEIFLFGKGLMFVYFLRVLPKICIPREQARFSAMTGFHPVRIKKILDCGQNDEAAKGLIWKPFVDRFKQRLGEGQKGFYK